MALIGLESIAVEAAVFLASMAVGRVPDEREHRIDIQEFHEVVVEAGPAALLAGLGLPKPWTAMLSEPR